MPSPLDSLQSALGDVYVIERELGGGSMSRVYLAEETAFRRKVVIKVLPAEMLHGTGIARFRREILTTAGLQHPHIVPVLNAGEADGTPYYTMPFVNGLSLRQRLTAGPMAIAEIVSVLRETAKALAYAHAQGVVHRDIKPENVLLVGGTVVVTDFGIAKAISAATSPTESDPGLTAIGMTVGTPAYMAPEQATGDRNVDHRADIYAFGCLAYELLVGRPPFVRATAQESLVAHLTETPVRIETLRADIPAGLASLVMACLEKYPALRPQRAQSLVDVLDTVSTSGGALHAASPAAATPAAAVGARAPGTFELMGVTPPSAPSAPSPQSTPAAQAASVVIPTPVATVPAVPVVVDATTAPPPAARPAASRRWRGAKVAALVLALGVAGYAAATATGILTLTSTLSLGDDPRALVAEFRSPATDSTLGPAVTEAFRAALAQSEAVRVVQPSQTTLVLRRMGLDPTATVDAALARQIAQREGIDAYIDGAVVQVGRAYTVNSTLYAAATGEPLATFTARARSADELLDAVESVVHEMRARVGESLRAVNADPPLERVTTPSLQALRAYTQAMRVLNQQGDRARGIALLEQAVSLDTGFAMAYRRLAVELNNTGISRARAIEAIEKAYAHRDRLTELERQITVAAYFSGGPNADLAKALLAYESVMELAPRSPAGFNNSATILLALRQPARAETLAARGLRFDSTGVQLPYRNLFNAQVSQGRLAEAEVTLMRLARNMPRAVTLAYDRASLAWNRRQWDTVTMRLSAMQKERASDASVVAMTAHMLSAAALVQGQPKAAARALATKAAAERRLGDTVAGVHDALTRAGWEALAMDRPDVGRRILDSATTALALDRRAPDDIPYTALALVYGLLGDAEKARPLLAAFDASRRSARSVADPRDRALVQGGIALAERRFAEAAKHFTAADQGPCLSCYLPWIALAHDQAARPDSAIAYYTRYVSIADPWRWQTDGLMLAFAHERLGELLEARGDVAGAATHYAAVLALWEKSEPSMRPHVERVRAAHARVERLIRR